MKKLPALISLIIAIVLWYACTQRPQGKQANHQSHIKISNRGVKQI